MKKKLMVLSGFALVLAPVVVLAQSTATNCAGNPNVTDLSSLLCKFGQLLNAVVPVLIALGVVYFVWGVISYVIASDEEAKAAGKNRIIFGIIGLAVIIGLWGLVNILTRTFGVDAGAGARGGYPQVPQ